MSPSDHVLLRPGDYAWRVPDRGGAASPLPHTGVAASASAVARAALATAVLANERAGTLRLTRAVERPRGWLGVRGAPRDVLRVRLAGALAAWPAGSLEACILASFPARRPSRRGLQLRDVVAAVCARSPGAAGAVRLALDAMAGRGVATRTGAAASSAHGADEVHALLDDAQRHRPALWTTLEHDVWLGLRASSPSIPTLGALR